MSDRKRHRDAAEADAGVALVTGGAVRLGRDIALGLAREGYDLVIAYHSSEDAAAETREVVESMGRRCVLVQADLLRPEAAVEIVDAAEGSFGRLDVLVNSAASFRSVALTDVDAREWDAVMNLNLRAPHLVVRAASRMLAESRGAVVNLTDLSAFQAWTRYPHHSVSKAALAHLTRIQARALAPHVRVNAVAPGAVLAPECWPGERWQSVARRAVLRRTGSPDDVVEAVLYLIRADFVTGHVLPVDGGRLLGPTGPASDED